MNPQLRSILAVVTGIVAGSVVIFLIQLFSPYQPPEQLDLNDKSALAGWIRSLPMSALLIVLLSYFLGACTGGFFTNLIAGSTRFRPALVTGFGLFVAGIANLIAIPHPLWFAVVSSLLYFIGAWLGGRVADRGIKPGR
jgi:hypothetical protein